jgi:hypothetical protein
MTFARFESTLEPVSRDTKHVILAGMLMATLAVMTYFITECVARVCEARAQGVSNLANALHLR